MSTVAAPGSTHLTMLLAFVASLASSGCGSKAKPVEESGCSKDSDCKGERICRSGECRNPPEKDVETERSAKPKRTPAPSEASVSGPTGPRPVPITPVQPTQPVAMASCEILDARPGAFVPSAAEAAAAAAWIPDTSCLEAGKLRGLIETCTQQRGSGQVKAGATVPGYDACEATVRGIELNGRRFVNVSLFVFANAKAHGETYISELRGGTAELYFQGFLGGSPLCAGSADPDPPGTVTSATMRADWPTIPERTRRDFFCSDGASGPVPTSCVEGATLVCDCPGTGKGAQTCSGGAWSPCACVPASQPQGRCLDGQTRPCPCGDGTNGQTTCVDGVWASGCFLCD